jgi:hypothetical protein
MECTEFQILLITLDLSLVSAFESVARCLCTILPRMSTLSTVGLLLTSYVHNVQCSKLLHPVATF